MSGIIKQKFMGKARFFITYLALAALMSCSASRPGVNTAEAGMFNISIMYPAGKDKTFDMDYYEKNHMPMMAQILGENLKFYEIDKGVAGRTSNDAAPFVAMCHFYCYDITRYEKAVAQNIDTILKDIKKYTDIQPVVQVSKVGQLRSKGSR